MKTFKDLEFNPHGIGNGVHAIMNFDNNYGVSVVMFNGSYGGKQGLYEIAILYGEDITYSTEITDNVLGWQSEEDVTEVMQKVQLLKD
jgi:hypothetical protein